LNNVSPPPTKPRRKTADNPVNRQSNNNSSSTVPPPHSPHAASTHSPTVQVHTVQRIMPNDGQLATVIITNPIGASTTSESHKQLITNLLRQNYTGTDTDVYVNMQQKPKKQTKSKSFRDSYPQSTSKLSSVQQQYDFMHASINTTNHPAILSATLRPEYVYSPDSTSTRRLPPTIAPLVVVPIVSSADTSKHISIPYADE
jgi:hypothetical protein